MTATNTPPAGKTKPEPGRRFKLGRKGRFGLGAVLVLVFLGSIGSIWLGPPVPLQLSIALALVAGVSLTIFVGLFIKEDLPKHWKRALTAGTALISLIAALVGLPALQSGGPGSGGSGAGTASPPPGVSASTPSGAVDPLTVTPFLDCVDFAVPKSLLPHLPKPLDTGLDANWIYEHGGAALSPLAFTFQGTSEDAVLIRQVRVIDLVRNPPPSDVVHILPCGPQGGGARPRYFEVNLSDPPKITAWPQKEVDENGERKPAVQFPLKVKVSNSDLELYVFWVTGPDCFCEWRLAVDWTSGGRSGTTVVGYGSPKIRSDKADVGERPLYAFVDGEWQEWG